MTDRDAIEAEVRACNEAFYRAFRDRDYEAMTRLWAESQPISVVHPGMDCISGRNGVMESWKGILSHPDAPTLECSRVEVRVLGTCAYVTCLEGAIGKKPSLIATNIFAREGERMRMVHHQTAPLSPAAVRRTEPAPPPKPLN